MTGLSVLQQCLGLAVCLCVVLVGGAIGIPLTSNAVATWYQDLLRPPWTPPGFVFAPVWTGLYLIMAFAAWMIWREDRAPDRRPALILFAVQFLLNIAWTPIFFGARLFALAAVEIVLLWFSVLFCILAFRRVRPLAAWIMLPYLAWVGFACLLNVSIWWLNR